MSKLAEVAQLFCSLSQRPLLTPPTRGYITLHLALLIQNINAHSLRGQILIGLRNILNRSDVTMEYQACQLFLLLDSQSATEQLQLAALRIIAAVLDKVNCCSDGMMADLSSIDSLSPKPATMTTASSSKTSFLLCSVSQTGPTAQVSMSSHSTSWYSCQDKGLFSFLDEQSSTNAAEKSMDCFAMPVWSTELPKWNEPPFAGKLLLLLTDVLLTQPNPSYHTTTVICKGLAPLTTDIIIFN